MPNLLTSLEVDLYWLCGIAGLGTLAYALYNMLLAQSRPVGHRTGSARQVLRTRYLVIATLLFLFIGYILWKPIPLRLPWLLQLAVSILGAVIFLASLVLYLWGLRTLGENFNASSGFGVRLHQAHQLVTNGPYAYIRHPMYLAVILVGWGGLLLYRTWTMLFFAVIMLGLIVRARKEELALAQVFGRQWELYKKHIPGWFPRLESLRGKKRRSQGR
jgi:protein-S-isoprenylcysteine O-methyltransferase Ste14